MPSIVIAVTLTDENEAILSERAAIVTEHIRTGMFGCDAPENSHSWKFTIEKRAPATEQEREGAEALYGTDEIEIDADAYASRADDGTWVSGWLWLPDEV